MNKSLIAVLELAGAAIPESLIDKDGYIPLSFIAEKLPFEMTSFWGFECRLGEPAAKVDILFEIKKQSRGSSLLAGRISSELDMLCSEYPAWKSLRNFAGLWVDPDHEFSTHVRNIWLEFDTASVLDHSQMNEVLRQPCIFFGPDAETLEKRQTSRLICDALAALDAPDSGRCGLEEFIKSLPENARIFQVGLMLARPNPGLRICVYRLTAEDVPVWLTGLNWPGDTVMIGNLLKKLPPGLDAFAVDLNLMTDGPGEKIGIECYMDWLEDDPEQWLPMLDLIEEGNLCLPVKRQGLMNFQGSTRVPDDWHRLSEGIVYSRLFRKIHHIKLSISSGQLKEAKAYLALNHPGIDLNTMYKKRAGGAWLVE